MHCNNVLVIILLHLVFLKSECCDNAALSKELGTKLIAYNLFTDRLEFTNSGESIEQYQSRIELVNGLHNSILKSYFYSLYWKGNTIQQCLQQVQALQHSEK